MYYIVDLDILTENQDGSILPQVVAIYNSKEACQMWIKREKSLTSGNGQKCHRFEIRKA